ncbi:hypothetical protein [Nodosilinea sp. E11]|uniref:hypothetical protein n=1 Tax=Nodosilinea sp. E11 TaxID=3037479 RepID=UPI0029344F44|nr:hypothetical protein [Nodosilinea sp. E11]WOD40207.1 hypothetical protein RRF56_05305 [Nodosilinea sp. E11]
MTPIRSLLRALPLSRALAVGLAGLLMALAIAPAPALAARDNPTLPREINKTLQDDDSDRPKTMGEWQAEARETEGRPLERAKRIVEESADAVKDWAELYPDVAERSIPALQDN